MPRIKIRSTNSASAIIAGAGGVLAAAGTLLVESTAKESNWLMPLVAGVAVFIVVFFVAQLVIRRFIIYKIKPLYQVVLSQDMKTGQLKDHLMRRKDIIGQIGSELTVLAERNRSEIERLKDNERYRREFLGNVSHEMKTPIFTLQGYVSTLLDGGVDDPQVSHRYLERAEKSIDRMINIITDLEEISKLESGVLNLSRERFDVAELTREIVDDASLEAEKYRITITVGKPGHDTPQPPVWVTADRNYIAQVITNLVINSVKYGREGGQTRISFVDMFDRVMVEVADNGIGIAAEEIPRVFERFYRTDKSRSREMGGTGLGLSIVKHIIEAHGQQISLRSQPEKGSTFSFTLPKG